MLGGAAVAAPKAGVAAAACRPFSAAQLHSILGLTQSLVMRNTVDDSGDAVDSECNAVVWSGPMPTSRQAAFRTAKSGHGAQVGIETWAPNNHSPDVAKWPKDYDKLTGGFDKESVTFPGLFTARGLASQTLRLPGLGYQSAGLKAAASGPATGLVVAIGCWWNDKAKSAVCLLDEEAASKPVVKHLNQLAKIAVPKVLG
jgi:hypothetical protein